MDHWDSIKQRSVIIFFQAKVMGIHFSNSDPTEKRDSGKVPNSQAA